MSDEETRYTSLAAEESIRPAAPRLRQQILEFLKSQEEHGATCDEVEVALGMTHQTASARFTELRARKLTRIVGERRTRSGRKASVHVAEVL